MILLTHGMCGSTCAITASHLGLWDEVRSVVVGGIETEESQQYFSFPGGEVNETPFFYSSLDELHQDTMNQTCVDCLAPRQLITSAQFRLAVREGYGPLPNKTTNSHVDEEVFDTTLPLEYTYFPADIRVPNTKQTALHPECLWGEVRELFSR